MNTKIIAGAVSVIIGFLAYQTGVAVILEDAVVTMFLDRIASHLPISIIPLVTILEFGGGILAILGFLTIVSGLVERREYPLIQSNIEPIVKPAEESSTPEIKCKYCGAEMEEDAIFCPACNKARV